LDLEKVAEELGIWNQELGIRNGIRNEECGKRDS
jgi:hypothetical protein